MLIKGIIKARLVFRSPSLLVAVFLLAVFRTSSSFSAPPPPAVSLSLTQAVMSAVKNNVGIQIEKETVRLRESTFLLEKAQFDPTFSFDLRANRRIRSSTSLIETGPSGTNRIVQENQRLNTGFAQRFGWGGNYDLSFRQSRSEASFQNVNPTLTGDLVFSFTQPLLQGFGRTITKGPIRIAQTNIDISESGFQSQISSLVLDVSDAYWDLVFQLKNLKVKQQTLQSARQLLASSRAKVELGLLAPIEILVAESGVSSRKEALFIAEKGVLDTEDRLRMLLDFPEQSVIDPPRIQPTDQPTDKKQPIEAAALLQSAITQRPEILQSRLRIRNQILSAKIAKNKLSLSFDLIGSVGLNGLGKDFSGETDQIESGSFNRWEAGIVLSFPIGNRAAQADLQRERIKLKQALLNQRKNIQQVTLETKKGLRRVRTDYQRIKATQRARELSAEKLSAGNERFNLGLISSHDLLEFQDDLADAKRNELKAVIDYNKSLVNLAHVTGKLLQRYQIKTIPTANENHRLKQPHEKEITE